MPGYHPGMKFRQVMAQLRESGTAQNRKVYARHGAKEPMFGVSFADLNRLKAEIGTDHKLAEQLWRSGNTDARTLATMVADPAAFSLSGLDAWLRDLDYYMLVDLFAANVVARSKHAQRKAELWTKSPDEWRSSAGWTVVTVLGMQNEVSDEWLRSFLDRIESEISAAPNRSRHSMNNALIAIGGRSEALRRLAFTVARRIGRVDVDHGETGCKTPDASERIAKMWERRALRRRRHC